MHVGAGSVRHTRADRVIAVDHIINSIDWIIDTASLTVTRAPPRKTKFCGVLPLC